MARFTFLIVLFAVAYIGYHLYGRKLLQKGPRGLVKPLLILIGVLMILAVLTGRANALFALVGGLLASAWRLGPVLLRFYPQLRQLLGLWRQRTGAAGAAGAGQASRVATATLAMTLDHASGAMDGEVLQGPLAGRSLSSLGSAELLSLHSWCAANDAESLRLLEAYLQREHPELWQQHAGAGGGEASPPTTDSMGIEDALAILGLEPDADAEQIIAAHRRLMTRLHPDKGGSNYLATRVNQARDLLLKQRG